MRVNVLVTAVLVAAFPTLGFAEEFRTCIGVVKYENADSDVPADAYYVDILGTANDEDLVEEINDNSATKAQVEKALELRQAMECPAGAQLICWDHINYGLEGCADTAETIAAVKREIAARLVIASK